MIPNISEFEAGQEFTAMPIGDVKISAPICFDGFSPEIIQKMVLNGANLIVLSGNLAWFGKSNAADYLEMITRWRSLENRVPVVFARIAATVRSGMPQARCLQKNGTLRGGIFGCGN